MNKIIFISLLLMTTYQKNFLCSEVFKSHYILFFMRHEANIFKIETDTQGTIEWGCSEIPIPDFCGVTGTANFIHHYKKAPCIIMDDTKFTFDKKLEGDYDHNNLKMKLNLEGIVRGSASDHPQKLEVEFYIWQKDKESIKEEVIKELVPLEPKTNFEINHSEDRAIFLVELHPQKRVFFQLSFLRALNEHNIITMFIFLIFGFILCFFGLKFYKE